MVYALLGSLLGLVGAAISLLAGAPVLTALAIYIGTGLAFILGGLMLAAICVMRQPDRKLRPQLSEAH